MTIRLMINLNSDEAEALARLAASELRDPRDQIRFVVRCELERQGLLHPENAGGAGTRCCSEIQAGGVR
jgi:hypothetical protein